MAIGRLLFVAAGAVNLWLAWRNWISDGAFFRERLGFSPTAAEALIDAVLPERFAQTLSAMPSFSLLCTGYDSFLWSAILVSGMIYVADGVLGRWLFAAWVAAFVIMKAICVVVLLVIWAGSPSGAAPLAPRVAIVDALGSAFGAIEAQRRRAPQRSKRE